MREAQPIGTPLSIHSGSPPPRMFDRTLGATMVRVPPGEFYVTAAPDEVVVTVLGSCVAACIRDVRTGYGGLNHFMLPASEDGNWGGLDAALRYGNFAMEALLNAVMKSGCRREDLEIKLFGGADKLLGRTGVGAKNIDFVVDYLIEEHLTCASYDLGGDLGRKIIYWPASGKVKRQLLTDRSAATVINEELSYRNALSVARIEGSIDLF